VDGFAEGAFMVGGRIAHPAGRIGGMVPDERLEQYLAQQGVTWELISGPRHTALEREWNALYGSVWKLGLRHRHGLRAEVEYSRRSATAFLIVPFLGPHVGPHSIWKPGPRTVAYECHGPGSLPDLSPFSNLDFFIAPTDLSWTMLRTHEDHDLGGPYFIDKDWLVPPTRGRRRAW
jgi:hypothetical protein